MPEEDVLREYLESQVTDYQARIVELEAQVAYLKEQFRQMGSRVKETQCPTCSASLTIFCEAGKHDEAVPFLGTPGQTIMRFVDALEAISRGEPDPRLLAFAVVFTNPNSLGHARERVGLMKDAGKVQWPLP